MADVILRKPTLSIDKKVVGNKARKVDTNKVQYKIHEIRKFITPLLQLPTYPSLEGSWFEFTLFTRPPLSGGS